MFVFPPALRLKNTNNFIFNDLVKEHSHQYLYTTYTQIKGSTEIENTKKKSSTKFLPYIK